MSVHEETPKSSHKAGQSCKLCTEKDTMEMVQCDKCDKWYHYQCVHVTSAVANEDWVCQECSSKDIDTRSLKSKAQSKKPSSTRSNRRNLALQRLQEEKELAEKREKEAQLRQQQIDKQYLDERFRLLAMQSSDSEEEDEALAGIADSRVNEWLEKEPNVANETQIGKLVINLPSCSQTALQPNMESNHKLQAYLQRPKQSTKSVQDGLMTQSNRINKPAVAPGSNLQQKWQNRDADNKPSVSNYFEPNLPTAYQLAARQSLPNELPVFTGRSEEWPVFITMFEGTTLSCGFNHVENLLRLQKCLKGKAYEAVRSRLTQPKNVPRIIETLKETYGRPDVVLDSLIMRVQNEPAPRTDKLESIIPFALAVDNICSTMEACDMFDHLYNPSVLRGLIEKLPPTIKLQWATYMETLVDVNLITFGEWLTKLSRTINRVTFSNCNANTRGEKRGERGRINVHNENMLERKKACCICKQNCNKVDSCRKFISLSLSEKWNAVKQHKLCRTCLSFHPSSRCRVETKCGVNGCYFRHNSLLHNPSKDTSSVGQCNAHQDKFASVLFRVLPIIIHGKSGGVKVYAFLDEGSSLSLMDDSLAEELGLCGQLNPLCLKWTGNTHRMEQDSKTVSLIVSGVSSWSKNYQVSNIRTVKSLDLPVQTVCMDKIVRQYPYLNGIPIESYENVTPRILIGLDNANLGLPLKFREGGRNDPVATKTRLGWAIYGPYRKVIGGHQSAVNSHVFHSFHHCECEEGTDSKLSDMLKDYFSLDSLGVTSIQPQSIMSYEEQRALEQLESETKRVGNRFETCLLWKYDTIQLPKSRPMAVRRFECLRKKLRHKPIMRRQMESQIKDYLSKGYIRRLTQAELEDANQRTWYLPIFPVLNPNKPGKIRIVWDAAAKVNGVSLNSVLLKGPDQLTSLLGVLYRFRERRIAICGDIREMYHQVLIKREDQQAQRFLWCEDNIQSEPDTYVMQVMTFGATCSPSCAQYVKNINALEFKDTHPRAVTCITENHYVDDLLESVNSEAEALQLATDVSMIHRRGGFEIGKWISNSPEVLSQLTNCSTMEKRSLNICDDMGAAKVLGMWWCTNTDSFKYVLCRTYNDILQSDRKPTKREVLRVLMSIFDPLGLIANFLIFLKILMQDVWRTPVNGHAIGWDDRISDEHYKRWLQWTRLLTQIEQISVPRCYLADMRFGDGVEAELHVFVDASDKAYAAVAYIRTTHENRVECTLIGAKTRVAPLKLASIPRLELEAARLGTRLAKNIAVNHSIEMARTFFWTDSKTVLCWIRSDHRRYRQFVAFRVGEIVENTNINAWRYVPTKLNVADEGTKWQRTPIFSSCSRWFTGPSFLQYPEADWPEDISKDNTTSEEIRTHLFIEKIKIESVIEFSRFSKWRRLLRSQVFVFRFTYNARAKKRELVKRTGFISREEYQEAENYLFRQAQLETYPGEISKLKADDDLPKEKD